ncbi:MAG: hypothetical protein SFT91_03220 [Rickettsiaceae bacterium]|nr:hypothetical protein [Rickettsiaceae bacterium]
MKRKINSLYKQFVAGIQEKINEINVPKDKKRIALISGKWQVYSVVYKTLVPFINTLKDDFDLVFVNLAPNEPKQFYDFSIFKEVIDVPYTLGKIGYEELIKLDCYTSIIPDISMNDSSMLICNMRLSPIQISAYGHPISTFSSEMDYFIGGVEVEDVTKAQDNYQERLVLIPGIGIQVTWPTYTRRKYSLSLQNSESKIIVGCIWTAQKVNYPLIEAMKKIIYSSKNKNFIFRIFPYSAPQHFTEVFIKDIRAELGNEFVEFMTVKNYDDYMCDIEDVDFVIDNFSFGGFCTVVDSFYLEKPYVAFKGPKASGRFAPFILEKMGVGELVTNSADEYVAKILELIENPVKLKKMKSKFNSNQTYNLIKNLSPPEYFKKAIEDLIENHETYKAQNDKTPIIIKDESKALRKKAS